MQPEERRAFEGKWTAISGRLGASEIPLPDTVFTLSGEHYAVESGNGRDEGRLVWGTQADPQTLDLVGTGGTHAGKTLHAIVRVRGDVMQLCYAVDGSGRPGGFDAGSGDAVVTVRYRRIAAAGQ